jgi:hypothetical protein
MEFPPTGWEIMEAREFETAQPRIDGEAVMEMMAQIRPTGRVADHWRIALGGSKILEADIGLANICRSPLMTPYKLKFQAWPKDVKIRRNMTSSAWYDGQALIARREFQCFKFGSTEPCPEEEILQEQAKEEDVSKKAFCFRFAVVTGYDDQMRIELQGLPGNEATLLAKPAFLG